MARGRKQAAEATTVGAAEAFLSRCFFNGEIRVIQPIFGQEYKINDALYVFTESVLDEMVATGRVKITSQTQKTVNIMGVLADR